VQRFFCAAFFALVISPLPFLVCYSIACESFPSRPFIFLLRKKSVLLYKHRMKLLSTKEAAERLGVSTVRVRQLIHDDKLKAVRVGRDYAIRETDLHKVKVYGTVGRPRKEAA
jgi:excisionase family DNA binding protein